MSALFSIRDQSGRRAAANSDHQSAIASPSNTGIALRITKITHSICRRPHILFSNAEVSITLNEQAIEATTLTCVAGQGCTVIPGGIYVAAVHVALTKAN